MHEVSEFWIDVGGTFTDCVARGGDGSLRTHKLLSSGVYKGLVQAGSTATTIVVQVPDKCPRGFFQGFMFRLAEDSANTASSGFKVVSFDCDTSTIQLAAPLPHAPTCGQRYELLSPEPAPVTGIRFLAGKAGGEPLDAKRVRLGTTRGTNALLERRGAPTVLVTTQGFGDVLEIAYQNRPKLFDLDIRKARPLYRSVIEARERLTSTGEVLTPLDVAALERDLEAAWRQGIRAVAIAFVHAHKNAKHEEAAAALATRLGFEQVSCSTKVAQLQRIVPRADTTVVDAYLTPVIKDYVRALRAALPCTDLQLMTSSGGLVAAESFIGKDSILSGPAGGVVGAAAVASEAGLTKIIGFDMGGTSTDVSRFDGEYERRFEMELNDPEAGSGVRIVAPMLAIETVAAGGGSVCGFDGIRLTVGPQSAGADPGPASYGRGGPLTVTDCNLLLGRILAKRFNFPLDIAAARARADDIRKAVEQATNRELSVEELALGFLAIAVSNMAAPIKKISLARGYDVRDYTLVSFGGAGAQHACRIADELGMRKIIQHPLASYLSAYGIGAADVRKFTARDLGVLYDERHAALSCSDSTSRSVGSFSSVFNDMEAELQAELARDGLPSHAPRRLVRYLDLRYQGQDNVITVREPERDDWRQAFEQAHQKQYGFLFPRRPIEVRSARLELIVATPKQTLSPQNEISAPPKAADLTSVFFDEGWMDTPVYLRESLQAGTKLNGPAIIAESATSIVVAPGWLASLTGLDHVVLERSDNAPQRSSSVANGLHDAPDPIQLTLFNNAFASVAEQMGAALQRSSISVNVKERLDFSCAIFSPDGALVVNAPHIPVHLGSMGDTVRAVMREAGSDLRPGDVFVTNDPYRGGSHLPDVTVITPVFAADGRDLLFFTGNRAHHAEIGGITPGSMPPFSRNLAEEGVLIRCFRLVRNERASEDDLRAVLLDAPYPSRNVDDNLADVHAQIAANEIGRQLLLEMMHHHGQALVQAYMKHIRASAALKMQLALLELPAGTHSFSDNMDDGTKIAVSVTVIHEDDAKAKPRGRAIVDFSGSGPISKSNLNANPAIVKAAVLYAFRCLINEEIPLNEGVLQPLKIQIPCPSILSPSQASATDEDPRKLPAVVGGNVETSQRLVDVLLAAMKLAAASQGTMNNLLFGRSTQGANKGFGYYETICGGAGAGPGFAGASAVHTHMTNTRITDPEVIEERFPVRLLRFAIRRNSGGQGQYSGGDGAIRELLFTEPVEVSLITSRRQKGPFGLAGGGSGLAGRNVLKRIHEEEQELGSCAQLSVAAGDILRIETPGGGAWGDQTHGDASGARGSSSG